MGWKQNNFNDCEYKIRLENIRNKMIEFRDALIVEELKKIEHLKNTIDRMNKHKAKKNDLDT